MMSIFVLLDSGDNMAIVLTVDIDLTVCSTQVCFSLLIDEIGFYHLRRGDINLWAHLLILISSLKIVDFNDKESSLVPDS